MDGFKNVNLNDVTLTASLVEEYFSSSDDDADSSIQSAFNKAQII